MTDQTIHGPASDKTAQMETFGEALEFSPKQRTYAASDSTNLSDPDKVYQILGISLEEAHQMEVAVASAAMLGIVIATISRRVQALESRLAGTVVLEPAPDYGQARMQPTDEELVDFIGQVTGLSEESLQASLEWDDPLALQPGATEILKICRAVLARWGQGVPSDCRGVPPMIISETGGDDEPERERIIYSTPEISDGDLEAVAQIIYRSMRFDRLDSTPDWVIFGNSSAQEEARCCAGAVLAYWGRRSAPPTHHCESLPTVATVTGSDEDRAAYLVSIGGNDFIDNMPTELTLQRIVRTGVFRARYLMYSH